LIDIEDREQQLAYLMNRGIEVSSVQRLEGGVSNRVVLVRPESGRPFVMKQALPKLRVQVDWFCTPARIEREALGLKYLAELVPGNVPELLFEDSEHYLLAMEAVPEPHRNWKSMLMAGELFPEHVMSFGRLLGTIHVNSARRSAELLPIFEDRSIYETLRIEPYYRYTASRVPAAADFLNALIEDTYATQAALVHGDYSPKNILIHQDRLILLDCEVVHFGDPCFDVGFSMAHLLSKTHHLKQHRAKFAEAACEYWSAYCGYARAEAMEARAVRHSLACCLARVAGRSPLEYLDATERANQQSVTVELMANPPERIPDLVEGFVERIACRS
jgi:tRNA A-37 threonylcarbamoyl transferase component Bud32